MYSVISSERKAHQQVDPEAKLSQATFIFTATRRLLRASFGVLTVIFYFLSPSELGVTFKSSLQGVFQLHPVQQGKQTL